MRNVVNFPKETFLLKDAFFPEFFYSQVMSCHNPKISVAHTNRLPIELLNQITVTFIIICLYQFYSLNLEPQ